MNKTASFNPCVVIPTYNNPRTIHAVVTRVRQHLLPVLVVDDGSNPESAAVLDQLAAKGLAQIVRRQTNGGKGAAMRAGFVRAHSLRYSHVLQLDADGQHDLTAIPRFLAHARKHPDTLVLGYPVYDQTVSRIRQRARGITRFWVRIETGGDVISDAMIGFRVYPLPATLAANARGSRMDFDIEIAVRLAWAGVPIANLPVGVRYLTADEGGVSHFRLFRDNASISWLHTRLTISAIIRFWRRLLLGPPRKQLR